jgi:hypothetical protein
MQLLTKLEFASTTRPKNHPPCAPPPFSHSIACQRLERQGFFFARCQENSLRCSLLLARLFHFLQKIEAADCFTKMAGRVVTIFRADTVIAAPDARSGCSSIDLHRCPSPPIAQQRPRMRYLPLIRTPPLIYDPSQQLKRVYRCAVIQSLPCSVGPPHLPSLPLP